MFKRVYRLERALQELCTVFDQIPNLQNCFLNTCRQVPLQVNFEEKPTLGSGVLIVICSVHSAIEREHRAREKQKFLQRFLLWVSFALLDPYPHYTTNADPEFSRPTSRRIWIHTTGCSGSTTLRLEFLKNCWATNSTWTEVELRFWPLLLCSNRSSS